MTVQLAQGRAGLIDLVVRTDDSAHLYPPRPGLRAEDVVCQLKGPGEPAWRPLPLAPSAWRDAGLGAYVLELASADLDTPGTLLVHLAGAPALVPPVLPLLESIEVVVARQFRAARPDLPETVLVGQLVDLDGQPIARATVVAMLLEIPLLLSGVAVAGQGVHVASDDDGFFELSLLTGATVDLQIPAARYRRTLVIPAPPAPGAPVRLFSIP